MRLQQKMHWESGSSDSPPIFGRISDGFRQIFKFPMQFSSGVFSVGNSNGIPLEFLSKIGRVFQKKNGSSIKPSESEREEREKFVNRERTRGERNKEKGEQGRGRTVKIVGDR